MVNHVEAGRSRVRRKRWHMVEEAMVVDVVTVVFAVVMVIAGVMLEEEEE